MEIDTLAWRTLLVCALLALHGGCAAQSAAPEDCEVFFSSATYTKSRGDPDPGVPIALLRTGACLKEVTVTWAAATAPGTTPESGAPNPFTPADTATTLVWGGAEGATKTLGLSLNPEARAQADSTLRLDLIAAQGAQLGLPRSAMLTLTGGRTALPVTTCALTTSNAWVVQGNSTTLHADCPNATRYTWRQNGVPITSGASSADYALPTGLVPGTYGYTVTGANDANTDQGATSNSLSVVVSSASWQLTVSQAGGGAGSVKSSPAGIDCGSTCVASFPQGAGVLLTATAAPGSSFSGWSGGPCAGSSPTCQVTLNQTQSVTATFLLQPPVDLCAQQGLTNIEIPMDWGGGNLKQFEVGPNQVVSFVLNLPLTGIGGSLLTTYSDSEKIMSISASKCDFSESLPERCFSAASEPGLWYATVPSRYACVLPPGSTYYVNVRNAVLINNLTPIRPIQDSCTTSMCHFWLRY